jgi:hypothetical protein
MSKKIVLEGHFEFKFNGNMGRTVYRFNGEDIAPQIAEALENNGMVEKEVYSISAYDTYNAGKIRITIERLED